MSRAKADGLKTYIVAGALRIWTSSPRYLEALATIGAVRWGLEGTAVDFVASEHRAEARKRLAAREAKTAREAVA